MSIVPVAFSFPHTTNPYPGKSSSSSLINRMNRLETVVLRSAPQRGANRISKSTNHGPIA